MIFNRAVSEELHSVGGWAGGYARHHDQLCRYKEQNIFQPNLINERDSPTQKKYKIKNLI